MAEGLGPFSVPSPAVSYDGKTTEENRFDDIKEIPTSPNTSERGKGKTVSAEEKYGKGKVVDMSVKRPDQEQEGIDKIGKSPASPRVSKGDKKQAVSMEEKSGVGEVVSMSSEMSGPKSQEQEGSDNSRIKEIPTSPNTSECGKGKTVSAEEKYGKGKVVDMSVKRTDQEQEGIDKIGKSPASPIVLSKGDKKQAVSMERESLSGKISGMANIIFLDRDHLQWSDPHIPNQLETSLPTMSSNISSNQGETSRPQGQDNTKIDNPKRRRWFKPFSWCQKK